MENLYPALSSKLHPCQAARCQTADHTRTLVPSASEQLVPGMDKFLADCIVPCAKELVKGLLRQLLECLLKQLPFQLCNLFDVQAQSSPYHTIKLLGLVSASPPPHRLSRIPR